jgi:hypothetical protein
MTVKPSDLEIHRKMLERKKNLMYELDEKMDELYEKIRKMGRELESDMVLLCENPTSEEKQRIAIKWQERAAKLQEVQT